MRDSSLLIVILGVILVSVCSSKTQSFDGGDYDEPVRMASESLVVKSYKDAESSTISTTTSHGDRFEEYQIYQGVMGRPGIDFPVYPNIPATNFNCRGVKKSGYYADLATDCQVFHICDGNRKISFLCPNGTIFRQSHLICDWWFRVDCGKSVELYEESAEQLAADQKIYKARSEERERRRKLGKALAGESIGELTSSEVYALDEPFHIKDRKPTEHNRNDFASTTARTSPRFEGRKAERNSKKVVESGSNEKFPAYNRDKQTTRVTEKSRTGKERHFPTTVTKEPRTTYADNREFTATTPIHSTPVQKSRHNVQNSINFEANKENFQPAESGSLVEDLNRDRQDKKQEQNIDFTRTNNFAFNNKKTDEQNYNTQPTYNGNQRTDQIKANNRDRNSEFAYNFNKRTQDQTDSSRSRNVSPAYNDNKPPEVTVSFNQGNTNEFAYTERQKTDQNYDNKNLAYTGTESSNTGSSAAYNNRAEQKNNFGYNQNSNTGNTFAYSGRTEQKNNFGYNQNNAGSTVAYDRTQQSKNVGSGQNSENGAVYNGRTEQKNNFGYNQNNAGSTVAYDRTHQSKNVGSGQNAESGVAYNGRTEQKNNLEYNQNSNTGSTFAYNSRTEQKNNFGYNQNNAGSTAAYDKTEQNKNIASGQNTESGVAYNGRTEQKNNFEYNSNAGSGVSYNTRTEQNNNFGYNQATDYDVSSFTTEFAHYESKRTNPVERHETVTPTLFTRKTQSSRYKSSTAPDVEQENQYLAETASFAGNRGSKSYFDYQNQFNTYDKVATTTPNPYKTTFYQTTGFSTTQAPFNPQTQNYEPYSTLADLYRTTTHRPVKQNSRKVTVFPSTIPQTTTNVWQTTTYQPWAEVTTANDKFTAEDVYFTTATPDKQVEIITESQNLGVSQKETEFQTGFDFTVSTAKPEVDITLQELNINKGFSSTETNNKSYEDFVREGLEVPPSSGPNALRSFALYFATSNNNNDNNNNINNIEEGKTTSFLPVTGEENFITTTLNPFELKKKEVLKQVDEIVHGTSINTTDFSHNDNSLPNSLTPHTKDSYSALFPESPAQNETNISVTDKGIETTGTDFETTAFESFTEEPHTINKELTKNDLDGSQSRGLVEPDPHSDKDYSKVLPDLRELAQVFTKALSAYLDDPEAFRRVLSEIRPTEPTTDSEVSSSSPIEYPSATQEDDEVLDFSDVTKATYKKKTSTASNFHKEKPTEYFTTEAPTTTANDIENLVLPLNQTSWATNIELTAPLFESLDQSQSSYYTAPPYVGTTNAIAEEINNEFTGNEKLPPADSNETVDSYLPIRGSVDDPSLPRYGGFQNNTKATTKYSPYGAELTSTTYLPYGADLTSTAAPISGATAFNENRATTFNPINVTSFLSHFSKNETEEEEIQLAKELNNLVLLQKFTTPRGNVKETTTPEPNLSTVHLATPNDINQFQNVQLGNGEILEKNTRGGKSLHFPESDINSNYFEPNPKEINLELSPPSSTPKGFLITYSLGGSSSSSEPATYLPKATTPEIKPTTYSPNRDRTTTPPEIPSSNQRIDYASFDSKSQSATEFYTTIVPTTISFSKSTKSLERLAQLQETLMFNTNNLTTQQKDEARVSVEEVMDSLNVTDSTANTLMKVMEMAAKNETYRRLVLLLVNDKSGKNKTVEEARVSLLKALLTPVINPQQTRTVVPISETARLAQSEPRRRTNIRRSKSIPETTRNVVTTTPTPKPATGKNSRRVKTSRGLTRAESNYGKSGLGNLGLIRRTIENSKNKQVRINSLDDAILDSDSRAVELLKSLYSLAARWG